MQKESKQYDPKEHEDAMYELWESEGVFTADSKSEKESFAISMPPPNATGELHVGHALFLTIQDILIRTARMQGKEALWLPGTDHAAIATESVVIRKIQKEEKIKDPRQELGREELINRIKEYVEGSRGTIRSQIRKMGASCDWTREKYTLDQSLTRCIQEVFKKMVEDSLIIRGSRIVNWDPKLQTNVSDDEVEWQEETTPFYTFKYGPFEIGTARPETKFGDKYVVMHPEDERYKEYKHGDTFECEWINGPITATVIKDEKADMEFGTGVMTITPWHDMTDYEIAERHNLEKEQIIDTNGKLLPIAEEFAGMSIEEARPKIAEKLKEKGLLASVDEKYIHNVAINDRGKGKIEPQIKEQWFIDVNKKAVQWPVDSDEKKSIKEVLQEVVNSGAIEIHPKRFEKTYFHWIDNLHDWCISRQIWWGHRIPVWYKDGEMHVGTEPEGEGWEQDPDTLDTWFSSALWTWSTLVDPEITKDMSLSLEDLLNQSPDFKKFHPTTVMETGYDIIFFWVARMILMTTYATHDIPFKKVFLHGLITTKGGKKMSKSDPEAAIDPMSMIEKYGSDATRYGVISKMNYGNQTIPFDENTVRIGRNFANKIWNIAGFLSSMETREEKSIADEWIAGRLDAVNKKVSKDIEEFKFGEAMRSLHDFVWKDFADWYIEILKTEGSTETGKEIFRKTLKLLHPFMPHVTEALWSDAGGKGILATSNWFSEDIGTDKSVQGEMSHFQNLVNTTRSARALLDIKPGESIIIKPEKETPLTKSLEVLTKATLGEIDNNHSATFVLQDGSRVEISSEEITDESKASAREKLHKEQQELDQFTTIQTAKLKNMKGKAPQEKIDELEAEKQQAENRKKEIESILSLLS